MIAMPLSYTIDAARNLVLTTGEPNIRSVGVFRKYEDAEAWLDAE